MSKRLCLWKCSCGLLVVAGHPCSECGKEELPWPYEKVNMYLDTIEDAITNVRHILDIQEKEDKND